MQLLEDDESYLKTHGFTFELVPAPNGIYLILKALILHPGKYNHDVVDVLILIPSGYNDAKLDMFYVVPELKLRSTDAHPQAASHFEEHAGRRWQRFSRHLPQWRAGIDKLQNFMPFVTRELQGSA